jgi:hypothetical protein
VLDIQGAALAGRKTLPDARRVPVPGGETTRLPLIAVYQGETPISRADRWLLGVPCADFAGRQTTVAAISLGYRGGARRTASGIRRRLRMKSEASRPVGPTQFVGRTTGPPSRRSGYRRGHGDV